MFKTHIEKVKGDWKEVLNDCRFTVNLKEIDKEPSEKFKKEILIAEHSPIRNISIKWKWLQIPHWVVVHWVRHIWEKYVATQRADKTGVNRNKLPQDYPSNMKGEANLQHLIDTSRKRLCFQASDETRLLAESLKVEIYNYVDKYIADVLVPNCIYRGGCPETSSKKPCKFYNAFIETYGQLSDIQERYDKYNKYFYAKYNR